FTILDGIIMKAAWLKHENKLQESKLVAKEAYKFLSKSFQNEEFIPVFFERICHIIGEKNGDDETSFVDIRDLEYHQLEPIENEIVFFQKKYKPPFTKFEGKGKRVSSDLSDLQLIALLFAFPGFMGKAILDKEFADTSAFDDVVRQQSTYDKTLEYQLSKRKFFRRRYSGDTHAPLSRERYFGLCNNENDISIYTLLFEMNAYAIPALTGYCVAVPGEDTDSIILKFRGLPGEPNPLYQFVNEPEKFAAFKGVTGNPALFVTGIIASLVPIDTEYHISIPCSTVDIELENAFDLRTTAAREWMLDFFRNPPTCETDEDLTHGASLERLAKQYEVDLKAITDWKSAIHITATKSVGGNAMIDMFAWFVRCLGCDGLIFPSARCDYGVVCIDGNIDDFWGWNLVDYRHTPTSMRIALELPSPLEKLEGINHVADITDGKYSGSLLHLGGSFYTRFANQTLYDLYALLNGPEWRLKNFGKSLYAAGYCWFEREFAVGKSTKDFIICQCCNISFPLESALYPSCPSCGIYGDLAGVFIKIPDFFVARLEEAVF
ncbi:MAG: hypothetical protein QE277_11120, partial [Flectobacillus sp.]|nr:hypothetical protein [Flectobacillus sp.]